MTPNPTLPENPNFVTLFLKPTDWQEGDIVHTPQHDLRVTNTHRTDGNVWTFTLGPIRTLQVFASTGPLSQRVWKISRPTIKE